jgi:hypothetical protein
LLRDEDEDVRHHVAQTLGEIGDLSVVPHLLPLLQDKIQHVRLSAAWALRKLGDPSVCPHLLSLLQNGDNEECSDVAYLLGVIGDPSAIPHLLPLLKEKDLKTRVAACSALGSIGNAKAVPYILPLLQDEGRIMCRTAAVALGKIGDPSVILRLLPMLKDEDSEVHNVTLRSLKKTIKITSDLQILQKTMKTSSFLKEKRLLSNSVARYEEIQNQDQMLVDLEYSYQKTKKQQEWVKKFNYGLAFFLLLIVGAAFLLVGEILKEPVLEFLADKMQIRSTIALIVLIALFILSGAIGGIVVLCSDWIKNKFQR